MRVATVLLCDLPDISLCVCSRGKFELRLADHVDHFVSREKVARVEVDPALALPDDDLPHREPSYDIVSILQHPSLHAPFVIVEDYAVVTQDAEHGSETGALLGDVDVMR